MFAKQILLVAISLNAFYACADHIDTPDEQQLLAETRKIANEMPPRLMAVLQEEISKGGFVSAINVCHEKAPEMAKSASAKTGWHIRRVSEKNRNPDAIPDAWELQALQEFSAQANKGNNIATMEKGEIVIEGNTRTYRYIKALPTQGLCLNCHGSNEQISPDVKSTLVHLYPEDKATGYLVNQIRGGITIKRSLPSFEKDHE